jgi:hypothetical protein
VTDLTCNHSGLAKVSPNEKSLVNFSGYADSPSTENNSVLTEGI